MNRFWRNRAFDLLRGVVVGAVIFLIALMRSEALVYAACAGAIVVVASLLVSPLIRLIVRILLRKPLDSKSL